MIFFKLSATATEHSLDQELEALEEGRLSPIQESSNARRGVLQAMADALNPYYILHSLFSPKTTEQKQTEELDEYDADSAALEELDEYDADAAALEALMYVIEVEPAPVVANYTSAYTSANISGQKIFDALNPLILFSFIKAEQQIPAQEQNQEDLDRITVIDLLNSFDESVNRPSTR